MAAQPKLTRSVRQAGATALAILFAVLAAGTAGAEPEVHVHLTASELDGVPATEDQREFDCGDTIHAVLRANGLPGPEHVFEANWTDPAGNVRERARHRFVPLDDTAFVWLWLKLHRPTGSALLQAFEPGAGMGEFMGEWTVELRLDGERIAREPFTVYC
jgi:hypothetical protein